MAIKVGGTEVVSNSRELKNIASIDSGTVTAFNSALNTDPTKGTLTKTFAQNETADITLSSNVTVGPVVSATKEVPQEGISTKGNWDVNSTASNYDFHNTAANVTLTPSTTTVGTAYGTSVQSVTNYNFPNMSASNLRDIHWKPDGSTFYLLHAGNIVDQYSCSTSWDVTTGTKVYSMNQSGGNDSYGLYIDPTGYYVFTTDFGNGTIYRWEMTTPWRIDTATYQSTYTASATYAYGASIIDIWFSNSGMKMWTLDYSNARVRMYGLTTAYDPGTSTTRHTVTDNTVSSSGFMGFDFSDDGTKIFIGGHHSGHMVRQWSLSTAYDLSSTVTQTTLYTGMPSGASVANVLGDVTFGNSGATMYILTYGSGGSGDVSQVQLTASTQALTLGSGSFASTDVGKRIVGNGGDVILTATSGTFSTTGGSAFTDNSTIAAGSWQMFGLKSAGDASGITISGKASSGNYTLLDTTDGHTHKVTLANTSAGGDQGFTIDPNGLYLYTVSTQDDRVKRYDFVTPWDLSTLNTTATSGQSITTSGYDGNMIDVAFNPSGTKMYVAGQDSDYVYQWNLSTAWDLSTASYTGSLNVQGSVKVNGGFNGLFVTPDGTKLYTICRNTDYLARWNFDSSQNVANASYDSAHWVGGVNSYPFDIAWNPDGSAMYLSGNNSGFFKWNATTAFEISSGFANDSSFSVTVNTNAVEGFFIKPDETKIYTMYNNQVSQWDIGEFIQPNNQYHVAVTNSGGQIDSSSFTDINSMTAAQNAGTGTVHYAVSTDGRTTWSVAKGTDGVRPIVRNNSGTWQYNNDAGSVAGYSVASGSYDSGVTALNILGDTGESGGHGIFVKPDGTKLYVTGTTTNTVWQYDLSTANDLSTASYANKSFAFDSNYNYSMSEVVFKSDGTKMYAVGTGLDRVSEYTLSTAWDVSTASYNNAYASVGSQEASPKGLTFKPDGTAFYIIGYSQETVYRYNLSTAWDVSTASYANQNFTVTSQASVPRAVEFNPTGTKMFISDDTNGNTSAPWGGVYEYNLSTAWDVSTATYSNNFLSFQTTNDYNFEGFRFVANGTKLWAFSRSGNKIYQFSTASSAYGTSATWVNGTVNDELYTLQQALGAQAFNRMDKTQLDAIPDANHFPTGTSLDLMIALRQDTAASTLPTSDGVTLNYDASALNEGAVLGTDYDFFHPAANKVQIKSLAAQNLKVRVV